MLRAARPIDDWLDDPATPAALRARLEKVREMRRFAATDLGLPDNRSYTTYADLKRPYVVWSVFATPELSLKLRQWCFPIVGCITYRGYYDKAEAEAFAATLRADGDDVYVGGIPAYSTLGYTTDPVLSTFIGFPEGEVARLIFHELAHQVVYVKGDTTFNESFAVAVEEEGVKRWFRHEAAVDGASSDAAAAAYRLATARKRAFIALLTRHRVALEDAYARATSDDAKRAAKKAGFAALHADYEALKDDPSSALYRSTVYDRYFAQALNNANLAAVATYSQRVPAFAKLIERDHGDMPRFYRDVEALAKLPKSERDATLDRLASPDGEPRSGQSAVTRGHGPHEAEETPMGTTAGSTSAVPVRDRGPSVAPGLSGRRAGRRRLAPLPVAASSCSTSRSRSFATATRSSAWTSASRTPSSTRMATKLAAWLQARGLERGARVAVMMPNVLQYPVAHRSPSCAPAASSSTSIRCTRRASWSTSSNDSGAEAIIVLENFAPTLEQVVERTTRSRTSSSTGMGDMLGFPKGGDHELRRAPRQEDGAGRTRCRTRRASTTRWRDGAKRTLQPVDLGPDDIAFLQYTGGTTGVSKGATLLHRNVVANILQTEAWFKPVCDAATARATRPSSSARCRCTTSTR